MAAAISVRAHCRRAALMIQRAHQMPYTIASAAQQPNASINP
jgi:hypothetical protein